MLPNEPDAEFVVCVFLRQANDPQSAKDVEKMFTMETHVDNWPVTMCTLCRKTMNGTHEQGREHKLKINELACCNEMFGVAKSRRRFEPVAGGFHPAGLLTKQGFRSWWGADIHKLPDILMDALSKGAKLTMQISSKKTKTIEASEIEKIVLCATTYKGDGKYFAYDKNTVQDRSVEFDSLLEDVPSVESTGGTGSGMSVESTGGPSEVKQLIDPKNEWMNTREPWPCGNGWWPTCMVYWKDQASEHGYEGLDGPTVYSTRVKSGDEPGYTTCFYQIIDFTVDHPINGWPIRMTAMVWNDGMQMWAQDGGIVNV